MYRPRQRSRWGNPVTSTARGQHRGRDWLLERIESMGVLGINHGAVEEHVLRRDDRGVPAGTKRVMEQPRVEWAQAEKARRSQRSRPGDLVLLRDTTAQHRGRIRKLDPQWTTPRVVSVSASGVSYTVRHHDPPSIIKNVPPRRPSHLHSPGCIQGPPERWPCHLILTGRFRRPFSPHRSAGILFGHRKGVRRRGEEAGIDQ